MTPDAPSAPPSAPPSQPRGCLPTLLVLLLMFGLVGAGFAAEGAVADVAPSPVVVADGVVIVPLDGWEFGGRSEDRRSVLLSKGGGSLNVTVVVPATEPAAALRTLLGEWRAQPGTVITAGEPETVDPHAGEPASRVSYTGTAEGVAYPVEGEVTAVRGSTVTVLFDGWSGEGDYARVRPEVDQMVREATIP